MHALHQTIHDQKYPPKKQLRIGGSKRFAPVFLFYAVERRETVLGLVWAACHIFAFNVEAIYEPVLRSG